MYNVLVLRVICKFKMFSFIQLDILTTDGALYYLPIPEHPGQVINHITWKTAPPLIGSAPIRY
jgi:hypothetical protein